MGYKVDDGQVVAMSKMHSNKYIANRLNISVRQVSRILKRHDVSKSDPEERNRTMDAETESLMMRFQRGAFGDPLERIGYRFGLSRQAVHKRLADN